MCWKTVLVHSVGVFFSDKRQRERLDGKVSGLVDVLSKVPQSSVLEPVFFILHISEFFHILLAMRYDLCNYP